jgi:hypothetical protein
MRARRALPRGSFAAAHLNVRNPGPAAVGWSLKGMGNGVRGVDGVAPVSAGDPVSVARAETRAAVG